MIENKNVLIVALGSGGDIISACNLKWVLEKYGSSSILTFFDFKDIACQEDQTSNKKIINVESIETSRNRYFAPFVSKEINEPVYAINSSNIDSELLCELESFCKEKRIDLIIGVDGGGDVFANYNTKILNVLPDTFGLKILSKLQTPSLIAVLAATADRELTLKQWESVLSESYKAGFEGVLDVNVDKFDLYSKIQNASRKAGKSYVNNVIKLSAEGFVGEYETPYGFKVEINPYQRFIFLFRLDFVLSQNGFLKDLSSSIYEENLNQLAYKLQFENIINGNFEEIKKRLDD